MKRTSRGFTLIELMIVVSILGIIAVGVIFGVTKWLLAGEGGVYDLKDAAEVWAHKLQYQVVATECSNIDSDGDFYVSCDVRVVGQEAPLALECHVVTQRCKRRMAQGSY